MKRTNKEVKLAIEKILNKYEPKTEPFYRALYRYWEKYDLTGKQCQYMNEIKNGLEGEKSI